MEKKTNRKKLVIGLAVALAVAALLCVSGITLARYVSSAGGTANTEVAKWSVSFGSNETVTISFGNLSPSMEEYSADGGVRSNESEKKLALTVTNNGEVDAAVSISAGTVSVIEPGSPDYGKTGYTESSTADNPTQEQVTGLFSFDLYYDADDIACTEPANAVDKLTLSGEATSVVVAAGSTLNLYAVVTWTSADTELKKNADALDTWVGENIESVGLSLTLSAAQASEADGGEA